MRSPCLTWVSEGNDFRRLLETSKGGEFVVIFSAGHNNLHRFVDFFIAWQRPLWTVAAAQYIGQFFDVQEERHEICPYC